MSTVTVKQSGYNVVRDDKALLDAHAMSPASFVINLFPGHWTLNNGPMFMYNNPVSSILEDIRAFRIPVDFIDVFDSAGVPYYEGCLIVELVDYRPPKPKEPLLEKPDVQRVVCRPNPESIWKDICRINEQFGSKMTDMDALELEAKILTSHPLCLDPDPHLSRVVNTILRVSTPNMPKSLKRKAAAMAELEEDEAEKSRRMKLMQFMNPRAGRTINPNYRILAVKDRMQDPSRHQISTSHVPTNVRQPMNQPPAAPAPTAPPVPNVNGAISERFTSNKDPNRSKSATPHQVTTQLPPQQPAAPPPAPEPAAAPTPAPAAAPVPISQLQPQPLRQPPQFQQHQVIPDQARKPTPVSQPTKVPSPHPVQPPSRPVSTVPQHANAVAPPKQVVAGQAPQQDFALPSNFVLQPPTGRRRPTVSQTKPPTPVNRSQASPAPQPHPPATPKMQAKPAVPQGIAPQQPSQPQHPNTNPQQHQMQTQPQVPPRPPSQQQHQQHQQQHQATGQGLPQAQVAQQTHVQMTMAPYLSNRPGVNMTVPGVVMQPYGSQAMHHVRQHQQQQQQQPQSGRTTPATNPSPTRPTSAAVAPSPLLNATRAQAVPGRSSPMIGEVARASPLGAGQAPTPHNAPPPGTPQMQNQHLHPLQQHAYLQQQIQQHQQRTAQTQQNMQHVFQGANANSDAVRNYYRQQHQAQQFALYQAQMRQAQVQAQGQQVPMAPHMQQQQQQGFGRGDQAGMQPAFHNMPMPQMMPFQHMQQYQQYMQQVAASRAAGQQIPQIPGMPPGMTMQQMQQMQQMAGMGRAMPGQLPNR